MSIYENAMRKEAGARQGINKIINFIASKSKGVKSLARQHVQDLKDNRYLYQQYGLKDYVNGTANYLSNMEPAGKLMKSLAVGSVAGEKALPYVGLTALGGGMYLLGDKVVDEYGNIIMNEAQANLKNSESDYNNHIRALRNHKKAQKEYAKAQKEYAELSNDFKYGLTGGGAVLGGLVGAGVAGEGNRLLGGLAGAGIGAGAGYGAYRIAKYLVERA